MRFHHRLALQGAALTVAAALTFAIGCDSTGKEGDTCNPLVLRDECNSGLSCQQITCARASCCPINGSSSDPNCNGDRCPSDDAGDASADDAAEASSAASDASSDAADATPDR